VNSIVARIHEIERGDLIEDELPHRRCDGGNSHSEGLYDDGMEGIYCDYHDVDCDGDHHVAVVVVEGIDCDGDRDPDAFDGVFERVDGVDDVSGSVKRRHLRSGRVDSDLFLR